MKAADYYEKYGKAIYEERSGEEKSIEATMKLIVAMSQEVKDLCDRRRVKKVSGMASAIKELNGRWNAMCKLFEKEYGASPIIRDGFREFWLHEVPELKAFL